VVKHGVTEFLSAFRDTTARFADHETDLWIELDGQGLVYRIWPGFERALGYKEQNILGNPIIDFVDINTLATFIKSFGWNERQPFNMLHRGGGLVAVRMEWYEFIPEKCRIILRLV
jgi:hypothetical protein